VLLALAMPAASGVLCLLIPKRFMWVAPIISTLLMFVSVIAAGVLYAKGWQVEAVMRIPWFDLGDRSNDIIILADRLSLPMLSMVVLISFLVHLYSVGFMADDRHADRYFSALGFFTFAMLGLVMSGNLLVTFCFWELVGFSSYLLIGHWRERPSAGAAATKAFLFNRAGDALFLIGVIMIGIQFGFDMTEWRKLFMLNLAPVCIFAGVIAKSAQLPLSTWLPDAMEGPTPVSALIHAATMVAAGVFLMLRIPVITGFVPGVIGAMTALYGGWLALQQYDLKKILAYSTISQLGLMIMAIGARSAEGAFVHLLSHAFFKACLFLAAGAIIHSLYRVAHQNNIDPQDIRSMGGLFKEKPRLFIATTLAIASICGLPFFSGFISKEMMIVPMIHRAIETGGLLRWTYVAVFFLSSLMTVLYSYRLYIAVFFGARAIPHAELSPTPPVMQWPVSVLAILSLWIFFSLNISGPGMFLRYVDVESFHTLHPGSGIIAWVSFGWTLFSLGLAWWLFSKKHAEFHRTKFSLDRFYQASFINPSLRLSRSFAKFDKKGIDSILHIFVYSQVIIAKIAGYFDRYVVDGSVSAVAWFGRATGNLLRGGTGGRVQSYLAWSAIALIIFIFWFVKHIGT
jgi:NADH-quinone oxidoreductase subunit L